MELIRKPLKLIKLIRHLPALVRHHLKAMDHFDLGDYAKALSHFARYEQIMLSMAIPLPPKIMLEKALCHQSLEQDDDAVAYLDMIWQRIRDDKHLNADEKAYVFLYMLKRAEPYFLTVKSIPPGFETFRLEQVRKRLLRKFAIPELEEL